MPKSFSVKELAFLSCELLAPLIILQYLYWLAHWNKGGWTKELINDSESHETIQRSSHVEIVTLSHNHHVDASMCVSQPGIWQTNVHKVSTRAEK